MVEPSDRVLLRRMRSGDDTAFGALYRRHSAAVRSFAASRVAGDAEAEDLTAEAFFRVLQTVRNGSGPDAYARAYLITVVQRIAAEWAARRRDVPVTDAQLDSYREPRQDGVNRRIERSLVAAAFRSLPERWRTVLWRVEVEGQRPASVARSFGLSANATAALARRARDGLRAAYLQAHLAGDRGRGDALCRTVTGKLGAYTSGGLRGAESRRVRAHLAECPPCRSLAAELTEVCSALRSVSGLIVVPVAGLAAAQLAPAGAPAPVAVAGARFGALGLRTKLGLAAASAGVVGALGLGTGTLLESAPGVLGLHGEDRAPVLRVTPDEPSGTLRGQRVAPPDARLPGRPTDGGERAGDRGHRAPGGVPGSRDVPGVGSAPGASSPAETSEADQPGGPGSSAPVATSSGTDEVSTPYVDPGSASVLPMYPSTTTSAPPESGPSSSSTPPCPTSTAPAE